MKILETVYLINLKLRGFSQNRGSFFKIISQVHRFGLKSTCLHANLDRVWLVVTTLKLKISKKIFLYEKMLRAYFWGMGSK